jgi:nucleotide-binding universal stress UspA family protein
MYRHILVPTDGSELSNRAVEYAAALAKAVNAKLTVFTVTIPYYGFAVEPELVTIGIEDYQKNTARLAARCLDVAKDIAAAAQDRGCDLIVMASHGRRGVAAIVLGSETVKVLTHSTIPVLVVRPKLDPMAFLKGS